MRSWLVAGIGVLLVIGFAISHMMRVTTTPPGIAPPPPAQDAVLWPELAQRAEHFIDLLDARRYDEALAMTTPEMVEALADGKLEGLWQALPSRLGQRQLRGEPRGQTIQGHDVVTERLQFKDVALDVRVVFDGEQRITGFHLVPANEPAP